MEQPHPHWWRTVRWEPLDLDGDASGEMALIIAALLRPFPKVSLGDVEEICALAAPMGPPAELITPVGVGAVAMVVYHVMEALNMAMWSMADVKEPGWLAVLERLGGGTPTDKNRWRERLIAGMGTRRKQ